MRHPNLALLAAMLALTPIHAAPAPLKPISATASSARAGHPAANAIDGDNSDTSRWVSHSAQPPHWIEIRLDQAEDLAGIHLISGFEKSKPLRDFVVQFWRDGAWVDIPSANLTGNTKHVLAIRFDDTVTVHTDRLRILITGTEDGIARVGGITVWPSSAGSVPPLVDEDQTTPTLVFLNQTGFNTGAPKRFTAPLAEDGAPFEILPATGGEPVFTGTIHDHLGDFTAFEPRDNQDYIVQVGENRSVPFQVGDWLLERTTYQPAIDFMIDSRHYVGNDRNVCGGSFGWRDDHHFGWELHTLVPQWLSNPDAYKAMPRQIIYEPPTDPKLWGRLEPPHEDAPDIIKLIHWGADIIVTQGTTHELMKSQLAYFLYAWPWMKEYLPVQNYEVVRDFAFSKWTDRTADQQYPYDESPEHDLLALKTKIGNTKGTYPPGFSIEPNLLMYEVAKREGRDDAKTYLDAAVRQAQWIVDNVDWNDPITTKGQRISEFITVTGLAHLLAEYPDQAPPGLRDKLNAWADVAIRRSDNLWDFRKLGDAANQWTPMGEKLTMWNEPGNVVGLPSAILALLPHLDDKAKKQRLEQIAWAHFDAMFGRNPSGRHFSYDAPRELEGVEHGWYSFLPGGIGRLAEARFVIDGSPKNQHYPFHPEVGNVGWTEGWIQHNTPFNLSLAYLAHHSTSIHLSRDGDDLIVRLQAPVNLDPSKIETATIALTSSSGKSMNIELREDVSNSRSLTARIPLAGFPRSSTGDTTLQATYGHGYLATTTRIKLDP